MHSFEYNTREALIQGLSIQAGKLFADLYSNGTPLTSPRQCVGGLQKPSSLAPDGAVLGSWSPHRRNCCPQSYPRHCLGRQGRGGTIGTCPPHLRTLVEFGEVKESE